MSWSNGTVSGGPDPILQARERWAVEIHAYPNRGEPKELVVSVGREVTRHGTRSRHFVVRGTFPITDPAAAADCARHWADDTGYPINDVAGVIPAATGD
ncbi:hypothetical protein OVY29_04910 [Sphingopyxis sp. SE2]|jgi:hypothetical protein|uniref:hypothetical protein n=1 Tax=Sphingopyxis sp. SE2 TaxID=1586240 RepID=UPI0028C2CE05|nr:hypothetical protein [Sphingopyxis sp. SE2]MDT7527998.1 hypothetical protein [Sphingopyxis sp. SE2]